MLGVVGRSGKGCGSVGTAVWRPTVRPPAILAASCPALLRHASLPLVLPLRALCATRARSLTHSLTPSAGRVPVAAGHQPAAAVPHPGAGLQPHLEGAEAARRAAAAAVSAAAAHPPAACRLPSPAAAHHLPAAAMLPSPNVPSMGGGRRRGGGACGCRVAATAHCTHHHHLPLAPCAAPCSLYRPRSCSCTAAPYRRRTAAVPLPPYRCTAAGLRHPRGHVLHQDGGHDLPARALQVAPQGQSGHADAGGCWVVGAGCWGPGVLCMVLGCAGAWV